MIAVEPQLSEIVEEEIELGEPGAKRVFNHASKHSGRFRFWFIWKQGFLDVADGIGVNSWNSGGGHQCQEMEQSVAVLPHDIESLNPKTIDRFINIEQAKSNAENLLDNRDRRNVGTFVRVCRLHWWRTPYLRWIRTAFDRAWNCRTFAHRPGTSRNRCETDALSISPWCCRCGGHKHLRVSYNS